MASDSIHQFNPSACQADFTYTMTPVAVEIQDTGKGKKSVADDLEAVLLITASVTGALKGPSIWSNGMGKWRECSEQ